MLPNFKYSMNTFISTNRIFINPLIKLPSKSTNLIFETNTATESPHFNQRTRRDIHVKRSFSLSKKKKKIQQQHRNGERKFIGKRDSLIILSRWNLINECFEYSRQRETERQKPKFQLTAGRKFIGGGGGKVCLVCLQPRIYSAKTSTGKVKKQRARDRASFSLDFTRMFKYKKQGWRKYRDKGNTPPAPSTAFLIIRLWRCTTRPFPYISFRFFPLFPVFPPSLPKATTHVSRLTNNFETGTQKFQRLCSR